MTAENSIVGGIDLGETGIKFRHVCREYGVSVEDALRQAVAAWMELGHPVTLEGSECGESIAEYKVRRVIESRREGVTGTTLSMQTRSLNRAEREVAIECLIASGRVVRESVGGPGRGRGRPGHIYRSTSGGNPVVPPDALLEYDAKQMLEIIQNRTRSGVPISTSDLTIFSRGITAERRNAALRKLVEIGDVRAETIPPGGPGRPTTVYSIPHSHATTLAPSAPEPPCASLPAVAGS